MTKQVLVGRLVGLTPHPNSPALDVGKVLGRQVVVGRHYAEGAVGLFIPEGAVVPDRLLREMWLWSECTGKGRLAGKRGNRVKARLVDGVSSEGLFYGSLWFDGGGVHHRGPSWQDAWVEGQDVTAEVGVTFAAEDPG